MNRGRRMPRKPRAFWAALRYEAEQFFIDRFSEYEDGDLMAKKLVSQFAAELSSLCETYQSRMRFAKSNMAPKQTGKAIAAACRVLGMDPPLPGKTVDMKKASILKKRLVRLYHPDVNGGSDAMREQYESVMQSWAILEEYQSQRMQKKQPKPEPEQKVEQGEGA